MDEALSLEAFRSALQAMMSGAPVGLAFEYFNERYAEFTTDLSDKIQRDDWDPVDALEMACAWTATNDAKNYIVLGDPAVRAQVAAQASDPADALQRLVLVSQPEIPSAGDGSAGNGGAAAKPAVGIVEGAAGQDARTSINGEGATGVGATGVAGATGVGATGVAGATGVGATGVAAVTGLTDAPLDYGLIEDLAKMRAGLNTGLAQLSQKLAAFLGTAIDNAVTLKVSTYTVDDLSTVEVTGSQIKGGKLSALTVVQLDGDVKQVVPVDEAGEINVALWNLHQEMVRQAQASRAELLRSAVASISSLASLAGPK
jgi:hypothetical protein